MMRPVRECDLASGRFLIPRPYRAFHGGFTAVGDAEERTRGGPLELGTNGVGLPIKGVRLLEIGVPTTRTRMTRIERTRPDRSVRVEKSFRHTVRICSGCGWRGGV